MWLDRRKKHYFNVRVDDYEKEIITVSAEDWGIKPSEAIRRLIITARVLLDPDLKLRDMVKELNWDKPLVEIIKPIPELISLTNLELKILRSVQERERKNNAQL